jgi:hypothetical protein
MEKRSYVRFVFWETATVLLLAACGEAAAPTAPTDTPTRTDTATNTPTFTVTPTIAYNMPGLYYFYQCTNFQPAGIPVAISINFCVTSVKVNDDRTLKITVTWKLNYALPGRLTKHSDIGNNNMFLYDDLENEYHATDGGERRRKTA